MKKFAEFWNRVIQIARKRIQDKEENVIVIHCEIHTLNTVQLHPLSQKVIAELEKIKEKRMRRGGGGLLYKEEMKWLGLFSLQRRQFEGWYDWSLCKHSVDKTSLTIREGKEGWGEQQIKSVLAYQIYFFFLVVVVKIWNCLPQKVYATEGCSCKRVTLISVGSDLSNSHETETIWVLKVPALHGKVSGLEIAVDWDRLPGTCCIQEESECNLPRHVLLATARGRC